LSKQRASVPEKISGLFIDNYMVFSMSAMINIYAHFNQKASDSFIENELEEEQTRLLQ